MANPRKFSEKIALHNKKQAEETAAFEAVLREVSATTQGAVGRQFCGQSQQPQHLTHPTEAVCRGGSLPNVKFASNNSIDLKNALHCLEGMKHESGRQSLIDKLQHRDRSRQLHEVNQSRLGEKRRDCSPYNLAYLSPPPDTSWRRANSDSAIHASTLAAPDQQSASLPINSSPPSPVNGNVRTVDVPVGSPTFRMMSSEHFSNMRQSCSCDVPGISIHPSPEQDSGIHIPPISSNTGSLPDLSELQFGVPGTPDDGTADHHSSSYHHIGPMRSSGSQGSPGSRHRRSRAGPKPLVLHPSGHGQFQPGVMQPAMMRYSGGSVSDCGTPSPSPISPSLSQHSYSPPSPGFFSDAFYMLQQQQQQNQLQQQFERASLLHDSPLDSSQTSFYHMLQPQSPAMFHFSQANCGGMDYTSTPAMSQPMPGSCRASGVTTGITPGFYNNSMPSPLSSGPCQYGSPVPQYQMKSATPSEQIRFNIGNDNVNMSQSGNRIPDIILTGADDMFGQLNHRDIDTARCLNDLLCFDEALGILDPLALDELQMLTDANVLTDQATEDSFRFD